MNGLEQLLIQNIASIVTAGGFLVYLSRKDGLNKETLDQFNNTINNHLISSISAQSKLAKNLQGLTSAIKSLNSKVKK